MREIKFRGYDGAEWLYGKSIDYEDVSDLYRMRGNDDEWLAVCYVSQNTGFKDSNEKEIYEGDIVQYNDFSFDRTGGHVSDRIITGEVAFSYGMWIVKSKDSHHDLYEGIINDEELEVIGNIYESEDNQ